MEEDRSVAEPRPWKVLSSEYVYQSPWLRARKDEVELNSGLVLPDYYVLEYPDWINAVLVTDELEVVLVRLYRHGYGQVDLELPAGCIDKGEAPLDACRREALEETGYGAESWESLGECCVNPGTHSNTTYLFLGRGARKVAEPRLEPSEEMVTVLRPLAETPGMLERGDIIQAAHGYALLKCCRIFGV